MSRFRRVIDLARDSVRGRRKAVFGHAVVGIGQIPAGFVRDIRATESDTAIAQRLLDAYARAIADEPRASRREDDVWDSIRARQKNFVEMLESRDAPRLAAYLCNMSRHDATIGTVQGDGEYRRLRRSSRYRRFIAAMAKDKLVLLAEAVGALPSENPEQGAWATNFQIEIGELVTRIEKQLRIRIAPPSIDGGLFKIGSDGVLFGERDCNAIYTAWLLASLCGAERRAVAEIGGGVGRVAYWSTKFGIRDYTVFDLPHINVLQGWYLLKSSCDARLYGESVTADAAIRVMPYFACKQADRGLFHVVLNQDSFPEIDPEVVSDYLTWMKTSTRFFLSINHESRPNSVGGALQNNVGDLIERVGGYIRRSRNLYWLRRGYVSELYEVHNPMRTL